MFELGGAARPRPRFDRPGRHRPQRNRGRRDRDQDDAPRERPSDRPRLPRQLPRRVDATATLGAEIHQISPASLARDRLHARAVSEPLPDAVRAAASRRQRRLDRRLHPRRAAVPRSSIRSEVAGVVIEPVLGSGGCIAPPDAFWTALTALCGEHGWLLCADEVKTGIGRGGTMFAVERWGVRARPDVPGQGAGRRRDADRRACSAPSACSAASTTCPPAAPGRGCRRGARRRSRRSTPTSARRCSATCATLEALARDGSAPSPSATSNRRCPRGRLLPGDRVRPRSRDARSATSCSRTPWPAEALRAAPRRLEHDLAEPAALASDAAGGARRRPRDRRRCGRRRRSRARATRMSPGRLRRPRARAPSSRDARAPGR